MVKHTNRQFWIWQRSWGRCDFHVALFESESWGSSIRGVIHSLSVNEIAFNFLKAAREGTSSTLFLVFWDLFFELGMGCGVKRLSFNLCLSHRVIWCRLKPECGRTTVQTCGRVHPESTRSWFIPVNLARNGQTQHIMCDRTLFFFFFCSKHAVSACSNQCSVFGAY
jgi:hypothetical protein